METSDARIVEYVKDIVERVRREGDSALVELTKTYDKVELTSDRLRVSTREIELAYSRVSDSDIVSLKYLKGRIERFENKRMERIPLAYRDEVCEVSVRAIPVQSVGCYVPGGRAAYPSTLLMTVVPAKVAGVPRIAVMSPPTFNGDINPLILVAADICGVDEVYRIGGAHAIAALAYGTVSVRRVLKIVGPGRSYVTVAKLLVSSDVAIDLPAGPSEIMILADDHADPELAASDMISQAEHGEESVSVLVTTSKRVADQVLKSIEQKLAKIPRREIVTRALSEKGMIILAEDLDEAVETVNEFAPEHVEVLCEEAKKVASRIVSSGLVLLGPYTPVAASDYCVGTNHVLPTGRYAHTFSGLTSLDYVRLVNEVECGKEGLRSMVKPLQRLSESEGLPNHFLAVRERFRDE